ENHGILKEIKENLEELSKITDVEKQYEESGLILRKKATLDKYRRLIDKIRELHFEALEKINASKYECLASCDECKKSRYETEINDNLEFCSSSCCATYYQAHPYCANCKNTNPQTQLNKTIPKDYSKKYCSDECLVQKSGISEILLNLTPQENENYIQYKKNKENKHKPRESSGLSKSDMPNQKKSSILLENSPSNQSQNNPTQELNNLKNKPNLNANEQARIKELEKELEAKQVEQKGDNYKLILGIGCGVLGMSLVGLMVCDYKITGKKEALLTNKLKNEKKFWEKILQLMIEIFVLD
ncbi:2320_t:CDS:2, partial [Funneliformis geosporum]